MALTGKDDTLEQQALMSASEHIVARNVTDNVSMVRLRWNEATSHLALVFAYSSAPSEDDLEWQELSMTELLAEFPDIVTAEFSSSVSNSPESEAGLVVYCRSSM